MDQSSDLLLSQQFSHFAQQRYTAQPGLKTQLDFTHPWSGERMQQRLMALFEHANTPIDETTISQALRQLRQEVFLTVMERDLRGTADLTEVTHTMTSLAECTVQNALEWASKQLSSTFGTPLDNHGQPVDLLVIGMGKLGGCELNVSSDIDLIFLYAEDGTTTGAQRSLSNHEFFERVGRKIISLLSEITDYGLVFRVDMRLRPYGDSGPLVCSLTALENYFITQGREWERYAWIKARTINQPLFQHTHLGLWQAGLQQLGQLIRPFVYRRYLDFGAIEALRDLHGKIKQELGRRNQQRNNLSNKTEYDHINLFNIKLGRGGIREIEFITQVFQLIRGGHDEALRERSTQAALKLCASRGYLQEEIANNLLAAYRFLRRLEHCLQYRDDAQTHELPEDPAKQAALAKMMGMAFSEWQQTLTQYRDDVVQQFDQVFGTKPTYTSVDENIANSLNTGVEPEAALFENLQSVVTKEDILQMQQHLEQMRLSSKYLALPDQHRARFERLLLSALALSAQHTSPIITLRRTFDLLEAIARRGAYLSLLCEYPLAFERVVSLLSSSSWAADYLIHHPILLDELIDIRNLQSPPNLAQFEEDLRQQIQQHRDDTERQMDLMREAHHTQVFRLLMQDLEGILNIEKLADYLSELADRILKISLQLIWVQLRKQAMEKNDHNWPEHPQFAIIGYGKLGGKELGYASDLDLIFLYQEDHPDAQEHYTRLAQRLTSWLSSQTIAGILFEIDLRLRPNGNAGLMVTSLAAFIRYQQESAWVWEHQALTRARFCTGDTTIGQAFTEARRIILQQPRDIPQLKKEVLMMREKMHAGHPNTSLLFDLKHDTGGMVDIEFSVQFIVLAYSNQFPELTQNLGNIALLKIASEKGLLPLDLTDPVTNAYRHFRSLQHQLRLDNAVYARVDPATINTDRVAVIALWQHLFSNMINTVK